MTVSRETPTADPERWLYQGPETFDAEAPVWIRDRVRLVAFPRSGFVRREDDDLVLLDYADTLIARPGDWIEFHPDGSFKIGVPEEKP